MLAGRTFCALLPLFAGLCACAGGDARYPSLAMRAFETAAPVSAPAPEPAPTRPLVAPETLTDLVAEATLAHTGFTRQEPVAARLARSAAGQPVESDARAAALVAMADLAAQRGATSAVLADLDRLVAESAVALAPTRDIETSRREVLAMVTSQDASLARLWETLGE